MSLQDESALIAERKTNKAFTMSGDVINIAETILLTAGRSLNFAGIRFLGVTLTNYFVDIDKDPVAIVGQLLEGYGYEMIMSLVGDCIIRKIPGEPSNSLSTNIDNIVLGQQVVTARRGANHIIVLSSVGGSSGQARGDAYDLDPKSPTYFNSSYGDVPETYTVNGLTSSAACEAAARAIAAKKFKRQATHAYPCIQIPKMDLGDGFTAHSYRYTADQISYSLVANRPMYLTGRGVHV
jgi:hypothetical protein